MNNELGRKITSLTLMTIMVAGGMTFAVPGVMPAAHAANANLFVSAENSQFDNYMSGPQVIEVVVIDSDINDTDQAKGEPDVTVNGKILRMVQGVDGNWYGYFADRTQASRADFTAFNGDGLDFGTLCATGATTNAAVGVDVGDSVGIALPIIGAPVGGQNGTATGGDLTTACTPNPGAANATGFMNVVREAKDPNTTLSGDAVGQIGIVADSWPFVQLYPLNPTGNVIVQYNKGGGVQSTTLTFDTVDQFADVELDRAVYPQGSNIHATITDLWLNIDPTDEDSWTFGSLDGSASTNYQVFDENGGRVGDINGTAGVIDISGSLGSLMCEDNCVLELDTDAQGTGNVITLQDNDDSEIVINTNGFAIVATDFATAGNALNGTQPVTITEQGPNSGVFGTYDESDKSVLLVLNNASRGTSATLDYNESPVSILIGHSFGSVDIKPIDDEWSSGEEIPIEIVDADANRNSRADEDLDLFNANVDLIPSLRTGDPFTLAENNSDDDAPLSAIIRNNTAPVPAEGFLPITFAGGVSNATATLEVEKFSKRAIFAANDTANSFNSIVIDLDATAEDLYDSINDPSGTFNGFNFFNIDTRSVSSSDVTVWLLNNTAAGGILAGDDLAAGVTAQSLVNATDAQSITRTGGVTNLFTLDDDDAIGLLLVFDTAATMDNEAIVADFFSFGFDDDGLEGSERVGNQIIRIEAEETGDNSGIFEGSLEYVMLNQLNILNEETYEDLSPIADDPTFIVIEDLTDEDAPRVNYLDLGADGVSTQVADQEEAPSHSGIVSFDLDTYKVADTVTITLEDLDLNVDSDLLEIYTTVARDANLPLFDADNPSTTDSAVADSVGAVDAAGNDFPTFTFGNLGRLLDVTFDDLLWTTPQTNTCTNGAGSQLSDLVGSDTGLEGTGFTLVESAPDSGKFVGDFQIPANWCEPGETTIATTTGLDIEVNYVDFRDASGEIIEVGDSAGVRANTGSVSLDRTVYPVPFGVPSDFGNTINESSPDGNSVFAVHLSGIDDPTTSGTEDIDDPGSFIDAGDLTVHIRINDPDFDISASGEDEIAQNTEAAPVGPVKLSVIRGANEVVLGYAGGPGEVDGVIDVNGDAIVGEDGSGSLIFFNNVAPSDDADSDGIIELGTGDSIIRQFGPIEEIAPDAGIFEADITLRYTDGPASVQCPATSDFEPIDGSADTASNPITQRFDVAPANGNHCILQGDILQVEYTDPTDASGDRNTVTDSATFDLRNGVLQSDKSVYIIGSDMILTLIEPDFDLDNDQAETYTLDLIEWDSDAATLSMGARAGNDAAAFDPEPTDFRETGDSTGIFQIVIEIPEVLDGDRLERGEEIVLEYTDWGPSGSDYVGEEDEDVNVTLFTSNFGATIELDQKVYTWTDKVYITVVAPDHNFDGDLIDEIGESDLDPIKVSTRGFDLDNYKLVETGTDTGIFTGEVILTGFTHDADGNSETGDSATGSDTNPRTSEGRVGPTDGFLQTDDDDGLTVSFEFSEDETVVGSALIRWNIGEVQWLEASYPASGTGVVRTIDPDMNLDPEAVDNFDVDVWSDSDAGGIDLTVTETNEATGIFEGTVFFTVTDESSGHRLRVAEGDTVTAEYEDNTLPDPYTTADELDITATSLIGTVVPPLERAPAASLRTVDAFGNSLDTVSVDQQVQISADLANGQDREQQFAYLVQIQDDNGVTVQLVWITGSLAPGQSFSPALSWIPTEAGTYTATAFVWESVDNPTALSPPVSITVNVR